MNILKLIKSFFQEGIPFILFCALFLSFTLAACDKLKSDSIPKVSEEGNLNIIYLPSKGSVLIDINAFAKGNQTVSFVAPVSTEKGTLSDLGSGLLEYKTKSATSAKDGFEIVVNDGGNIVKNDSVILIIENDPGNLPKGIYPNQDLVFGVKNNTPIELDVLANDYLSQFTANELTLSILTGESLPPYFGSANIHAGKITYTANASFKNADKIIYKVSAKNDSSIFAYGHVYLTSEGVCDFKVNDDIKEINEEFTQTRIAGLANDVLCKSIASFQLTISKTPAKGTVYIEDDQFVYAPSNLASNGFEDGFDYTLCIDGVCKTAKVIIRVKM